MCTLRKRGINKKERKEMGSFGMKIMLWAKEQAAVREWPSLKGQADWLPWGAKNTGKQ